MTDHADVIRQAHKLDGCPSPLDAGKAWPECEVCAALDALVAERDAFKKESDSLLRRLEKTEAERDEALNSNATLTKAWYAARKERDQLCEAIASAMGSLATGPARDGYAYSVLGEALSAALTKGGHPDD